MNEIEYIRSLRPVLDKKNRYVFFGNHKAGLTSINRSLLKNRAIIHKDNHVKYDSILNSITDLEIEKLFKFTIIRNPWSRVVSAFFYLQKVKIIKDKSFKYFIENTDIIKFNIHFHEQYNRAFYEGKQFVDFIGRLENIEKDWKYIASQIDCPDKLPHRNKTKHKHYTEYYDEECKQIISEIYADDIKLFNYTFEGE